MKFKGREIKLVSGWLREISNRATGGDLTKGRQWVSLAASEMNITKSIKQNRCGASARHQVMQTAWQVMRPASGIVSS